MKKVVLWSALAIMFAALLTINWWCIPAHDELSYTFQGECTPRFGTAHHISSLGDIVRSEMAEYSHGPSGRVFLHAFVQLFAGWELYHFFDVCNTIVWFLLVWLVLTEAKVRLSLRSYALGAAVLMCFYYYCETCTYNMAFAINYLWFSCVTILFVRAWRKYEAWWMLPVAFFYGWGQEVFSLAVLAGFGFIGFIRFCRERRYPWNAKRTLMYLALLLGVIGCCGSHFLSGRAADADPAGLMALFMKLAKAQFSLIFVIWPSVLILSILLIVWFNRKRLADLFTAAPEWWAIFLFGYLEYCALGSTGLRIASPMLLSGVILLFLNRGQYRVLADRLMMPCIVFAALWLAVAAVLQFRIGGNLESALSMYRNDPQGVAYREPTTVGLWGMSVSPHLFNVWHRGLFRHQFKLDQQPSFLSRRLYETLYKDSSLFFKEAEEVVPGGYVLPGESNYIVFKGACEQHTAEEQQKFIDIMNRRSAPVGWRRFLPGRLRVWFPPADFYIGLPSESFVITADDGKVYSIVTSFAKE